MQHNTNHRGAETRGGEGTEQEEEVVVVKMVRMMTMMTRDATDQMRDTAVTDIPMVTSRGNAESRKKKPAEEDRKVKRQEVCV